MEYYHNDLFGNYQKVGDSDIFYEQIRFKDDDGIFLARNKKDAHTIPITLQRIVKIQLRFSTLKPTLSPCD